MKGISTMDRLAVSRGMQGAVHHALDAFRGETPMTAEMRAYLGVDPREAMAKSVEERMVLAYDWARFVTVKTQPSNLPENLPHFSRDKWLRILTSFSGYTNVAGNALMRTGRIAAQHGFRNAEANRAALMAAFTILFLGNLGVGLLAYGQAWVQGREPPEWWKVFVGGLMSYFFGVREFSGLMYRGGIETPTAGAVKDVAEATQSLLRTAGDGDADRTARAMERTAAALLKLEGIPWWTPRQYVTGIWEHLDLD